MIKLLIVDDDEIIKEGMEKNIPWKENGIVVIGTASNGVEGLKLVEERKPQIILSDIRMPFVDGLQMIERVGELYPWIKAVFLTGYGDFEYAKKALNLKVTQYVLKYEENNEILNAVLKAKNELTNEMDIRDKISRSGPHMVNRFFCDLLLGIISKEMVENETQKLHIRFEGDIFCVAVVNADSSNSFFNSKEPKDLELFTYAIQNICSEILEGYGEGIYCNVYNQRVNIIFSFEKERGCGQFDIEEILKDVKDHIEKYLKIKVSIGTGNAYEGFKNIPVSYREALMVLEMKEVMGKSGIIKSSDLNNSDNAHYELLNKIIEYIKQNYFIEGLSLNDIGAEVHISPTYISTLFKKHTGRNFSDYLIDIRMSKAIDLMKKTSLKAYEIGEKVGYTNSQYFYVVFKKYTGKTPSEFKEQNSV